MIKRLEKKLQHAARPYLLDRDLELFLDSSPDSRYSKVKRLLAQKKLLRLRRGLYCMTQDYNAHPFELAQYIYGPSYISLESALSFHNLIPEAVYTTTSVTSKRSKTFKTPLGVFSYAHLPPENLYISVELIKKESYQFLIAKPWKAICDYVFCYKKPWNNITFLAEDLRIDPEDLPELSDTEMELLDEYYRNKRISQFLKGVRKNLRSVL